MPKILLSAGELKRLIAKPHRVRTDYFDAAHPGLCLRVGPRDAVWFLFRRVNGKLHRLRLGSNAELAREGVAYIVARQRAGALIAAADEGRHPVAEIARKRTEAAQARQADIDRLLPAVAERFWLHHLAHNRRGQRRPKDRPLSESARRDYRRALDQFVAKFGERDVATITRKELAGYLRSLAADAPAWANIAAVVVRRLFAFAHDALDLEQDAAAGLPNPSAPSKRDRTLTPAELRVVWHGLAAVPFPYGPALRLAICTGQRIGEIGAMRWRDVTGTTWMQRSNKARRPHAVHLAKLARAALGDCPRFEASDYIFSATAGRLPLASSTWSKAKPRHVDPAIESAAQRLRLPVPEAWTPHDLRRTFASLSRAESCGVTVDGVEAVLNHALTGARAHYDHAERLPHVRTALEAWDRELARIIAGRVRG